MEREYEEAVTDIKAAIFDVVDSEKKTNASLSDMISNEVDDNKKEELSNILDQKKEILDTILSNIDSIIDNVEMLDKINYDNNLKTDYVKSEIETTNTYETEDEEEIEEKTEEDNEEEIETDDEEEETDDEEESEESEEEEDSDNELEEPIITEEDENDDDENEDEDEETEDEEDSEDIEDIVDVEETEDEEDSEDEEETEDEESEDEEETEDDEEPVLTEIKPAEEKIAFNKEDNTAPRAIMVIETQEKKLRNSYDSQLDKVKAIGLFDDYNYDNSTKNTLAGDVINEDVAAKLNLEGKSIEDLTVLKQVYSDEGEVEAVKVIEAKMRELEEQTTETENTSE